MNRKRRVYVIAVALVALVAALAQIVPSEPIQGAATHQPRSEQLAGLNTRKEGTEVDY